MRKILKYLVVVLVLVVITWNLWPRTPDVGRPEYFTDQTYNFETIRVLDDIAVAGGDNNEAAQAIRGIRVGDADGWYTAWKAAGDRATALAARTQDRISRGNALLRAHTYYRSAEFFLAPSDARRPAIWKLNVDCFYSALDDLGVRHERITVPYGAEHHLNAVYYPGPALTENRPLLVAMTGYDGTMEELYAWVVTWHPAPRPLIPGSKGSSPMTCSTMATPSRPATFPPLRSGCAITAMTRCSISLPA